MDKKDIIYINEIEIPVRDWNLNLLQFCEEVELVIPRFCYHDELSVAGNCRMCLIEVVHSPKPVISCGCMLTKEMKVFTNSTLVKKAREYVMEFLLINHPLDCPICDQGGECDLQDQSFVYGSDRGRFKEIKRAVEDIDLGPFIKTIMNRCIHCTRCIRFSKEILNIHSLSMLGRGRESEVGTYYNQDYLHELSGNVIDLCPVGALTSKPYAFSARPWELYSMETIDVLNSFCSDIKVDVKGNEVMRILPITDKIYKTDWISDSIRFCFDGFKKDRLVNPLIYDMKENFFYSCSWEFSFFMIQKIKSYQLTFFKGDNMDVATISLINELIRTSMFFYQYNKKTSSVDNINQFLLNRNEAISDKKNITIFLNTNMKKNNPVLDSIIKKKKNLFKFFYIGTSVRHNYEINHLSLKKNIFYSILKGKHFVCNIYKNYNLINIYTDRYNVLEKTQSVLLNRVPFTYKLNLLNHETTLNNQSYIGNDSKWFNFSYSNKNKNTINILLNYSNNMFLNKQLLSYNIFIGHHMINNSIESNLILPARLFLEDLTSYYNLSGILKKTTIIQDYLDLCKSLKEILYLFTNDNFLILKKIPFFLEKKGIFTFSVKKKNINFFYTNSISNQNVFKSYTSNLLSNQSIFLLKAEFEKKQKKLKNFNF
jgi:NADH dehydrogenase (ubiquinone) Fe-S protein 1